MPVATLTAMRHLNLGMKRVKNKWALEIQDDSQISLRWMNLPQQISTWRVNQKALIC